VQFPEDAATESDATAIATPTLDEPEPQGLTAAEVRAMFPALDDVGATTESDDEVQLVGMECKCPECSQKALPIGTAQIPDAIPIPDASQPKIPIPDASQPRIPIPDARKGKQRTETVKTKSVMKAMKKKAKAKAKARKRPAAAGVNDGIVKPVSKVSRRNTTEKKPAETYLMQSTESGKYICGLTARQNPNHENIVMDLHKLINDNQITTKSEAKKYLADKCGI
jgi:hypothetical protein